MNQHTEIINGVTYAISIDEDIADFRIHHEPAVVRHIEKRLAKGDIWAWADVTVTASITVEGQEFSGSDSISGCCYRNVKDWIKNSDYYQDMRDEAWSQLRLALAQAVNRGESAAKAMAEAIVPERTATVDLSVLVDLSFLV